MWEREPRSKTPVSSGKFWEKLREEKDINTAGSGREKSQEKKLELEKTTPIEKGTLVQFKEMFSDMLTIKEEEKFYIRYVAFQKAYEKLDSEARNNEASYEFTKKIEDKLGDFQLEAIRKAANVLRHYKEKNSIDIDAAAVVDVLNYLNAIPCLNVFAQGPFLNTLSDPEVREDYQYLMKNQSLFEKAIKEKMKASNSSEKTSMEELVNLTERNNNHPFSEIHTCSLARWIAQKSNKSGKFLSFSAESFFVKKKNTKEKVKASSTALLSLVSPILFRANKNTTPRVEVPDTEKVKNLASIIPSF
jgi:hypothetical protein